MNECKLYICTALFICLTAVKLCFPEATGQLQQSTYQLFCQQADYGELVQAMGRSLNSGEVDEQMVQVIALLKNGEADHAG